MAQYASGSITFNGLGSDIDFNDMISKLYKIEGRYAQQLLRWKTDWTQRAEAFSQIRTELTSLRSTLAGMNTIDKFLVKSTSSSKAEVATATSGSATIDGTYRLEVKQLATTPSWSFQTSVLNKFDSVNTSGADQTFQYTYKGKQQTITVPPGTTMEGLTNLINKNSKNPGVRAALIQSSDGLVFQLRGMDTGTDATLTIDWSDVSKVQALDVVKTWETTTNSAQLNTVFANTTDVVNTSAETKTFIFSTYDAAQEAQATKSVEVPPGTTLSQLVTAINDAAGETLASLQPTTGGFLFRLDEPSTPANFQEADLATIFATSYDSLTSVINNSSDLSKNFTYSVYGKDYTVNLKAGGTLQDLAAALNAKHPGVFSFTKDDGTGKYQLVSNFQPKEHPVTVSPNGTLPGFAYVPASSPTWQTQQGQNAQVRVNGWPSPPQWLDSSSNAVKGVVEGMTFNLHSEGETTISVALDTQEILKNVEEFVTAVNSFRTLIKTLTAIDTEKKVLSPEYAETQSEMQKGAILTGNYGIQLMGSRLKQAVAGKAVGFNYAQEVEGYMFGDLFTTLSQAGIMTNSDPASKMYGLLEVKYIADGAGMTLEQALEKDPQAVAELFAAKSQGKSDSPYFGHSSHVAGLTKAGTYDVKYTTDDRGQIVSATINGKPARINNDTKQIGLSSADAPKNNADGLFLDIYDVTPNSTRTGRVNIRDGKINELLGLLDGEEGMLNGDKGALGILERNYKTIMGNIDNKITKEDERLTKWQRTMTLKFSRLETTLSRYKSLQSSLDSQLAQLGSSSSS